MITKNELKLINGYIIESSKLPSQAKIQLLQFVQKEASETQLKALLLDGKIINKIDPIAEEIINDRFENFIQEGLLKTLFGMFLLTPVGWVAYRLIKSAFSATSRKCGTLSIGKSRDMCYLRAKITKFEKLIALIKREMSNCTKSKDPSKCKAQAEKKIDEWQIQIKELNGRIQDMGGAGGQLQ